MKSSIDNSVTLGGKQVIKGYKTFSNANPSDQVAVQMNNINQNSAPASNTYGGIVLLDVNGKRVGKLEARHLTDGSIDCALSAGRNIAGTQKYASMSVGVQSDGSAFCRTLEPKYSSLIGLGMTLGTAKVMPADGILYANIRVGSQTGSLIQVYDGSGHAIAKFGHNGGSAEYNLQCFTMIVAKGQSVNITWNNAGTGAIDSTYLAAWNL